MICGTMSTVSLRRKGGGEFVDTMSTYDIVVFDI
jgi:hypothetical protein